VCPNLHPGPGRDHVHVAEKLKKFTYDEVVTEFVNEDASSFTDSPDPDRLTFGRRLRHLRRARGLTLAELGARVDRAPSALSML
jgi:hypothetical protein